MSRINRRHNFATTLVKFSRDHFRALFNTVPMPLVEGLWGSQFEVLNVNPAALDLFCAKNKDHFQALFYSLLLKIPHKLFLELLSARVKGDFFETELRLPDFSGKHIHIFMRLVYMPAQNALGPQHVVMAFHDISAHRKKESFFRKLSQIDGLTKVFNHRYVLQRLDHELARASRYELDLSCALLDVDHFKEINDQYGHLRGDRCLKSVAGSLKTYLRRTDIIGRYGGDQFLVIMPETKPEQALVPVRRFLKSDVRPYVRMGKGAPISFSVGIGSFPGDGIDSPKALMKAADKALDLAKTSGGNRCHVFHHELKLVK